MRPPFIVIRVFRCGVTVHLHPQENWLLLATLLCKERAGKCHRQRETRWHCSIDQRDSLYFSGPRATCERSRDQLVPERRRREKWSSTVVSIWVWRWWIKNCAKSNHSECLEVEEVHVEEKKQIRLIFWWVDCIVLSLALSLFCSRFVSDEIKTHWLELSWFIHFALGVHMNSRSGQWKEKVKWDRISTCVSVLSVGRKRAESREWKFIR